MSIFKSRTGSVTVEATLVLPIFISAVITIGFLIKAVYVHELVQHALNETANELAVYGYLYHVSGAEDVNASLQSGLKSKSQLFKDHLSTVIESFDSLENDSINAVDNAKDGINSIKSGNLDESIGSVNESAESIINARDNFDKIIGAANEAGKNPKEELASILCMFADDNIDDVETGIFTPIVKLYIKKHFNNEQNVMADERLKQLNIINGFEGLDFSESKFFADENGEIDIVVKYKLHIPVPFDIIPDMTMKQRATSKAWLGGDNSAKTQGSNTGASDDWKISDNFKRGKTIIGKFGANLPDMFPGINRFDSQDGKAVKIVTIRLTDDYYQNSRNIKTRISSSLKDLTDFKGGKKANVEIKGSWIKEKELLIIVPKGSIRPETQQTMDECVRTAQLKGIKASIQEY